MESVPRLQLRCRAGGTLCGRKSGQGRETPAIVDVCYAARRAPHAGRLNGFVMRKIISLARVLLLGILLLTWPLAWKYTSLGLDIETRNGPITECTYYRVRWPG